MTMNRTEGTIAITFSLIGLVTAGGALALAASTISFRSSARLADGVVTDLTYRDSTARAVVGFVDATGLKHQLVSSVGSNPPAYSVGEHVRVHYQVDRPEQARSTPGSKPGVHAAFSDCSERSSEASGAGCCSDPRGEHLAAELRASGNRVQGKLVAVEYDTSLTVNGRSPWVLSVQWLNPATGEVHVFHSDRMWFDPSPYLSGEVVDGLIDPCNPRRHWVDTTFLPRQAS